MLSSIHQATKNTLGSSRVIARISKSIRVRALSSSSTDTAAASSSSKPPQITLYQYSICPFCNINKALLSYTNTPYKIKEVNPLTKAEIKFSKDYKKVPILLNDAADSIQAQVNGSKEINQALLQHPFVKEQLINKLKNGGGEKDSNENAANTEEIIESFANTDNAKRWNDFATNELAPVLYPNICRSLSESYDAFGYVKNVNEFSLVQKSLIRGIGSLAMYFAASRIKKKRNITDERMALLDILTQWEEEGLDNGKKQYGSGLDRPDLGDVAMFGVMHSVSGLRAHDDVILNNNDNGAVVADWYKRMAKEVL